MAPVFLLNPASALGRVFPARPLPKTGEDGAIYFAEGTATHRVPVIVGPTAYLGVGRFHRGEFKPALAQKALDQRFDLLQQFFRSAGDYEVKKACTFFFDGLMSSFPSGYLRTFCPRKSKPVVTCVMDDIRETVRAGLAKTAAEPDGVRL
jgi:hypothetical protein